MAGNAIFPGQQSASTRGSATCCGLGTRLLKLAKHSVLCGCLAGEKASLGIGLGAYAVWHRPLFMREASCTACEGVFLMKHAVRCLMGVAATAQIGL